MNASIRIDAIVSDQTVLVGFQPTEQSGSRVRAVNLVPSKAIPASPLSYWTLSFGIWTPAALRTLFQVSLNTGLPLSGIRVEAPISADIQRGEVLAVRFRMSGKCAAIEGLSICPEYAILTGAR